MNLLVFYGGSNIDDLLSRHFSRETAKYNGDPPPETRLIMGQVGAVLVPIGW